MDGFNNMTCFPCCLYVWATHNRFSVLADDTAPCLKYNFGIVSTIDNDNDINNANTINNTIILSID